MSVSTAKNRDDPLEGHACAAMPTFLGRSWSGVHWPITTLESEGLFLSSNQQGELFMAKLGDLSRGTDVSQTWQLANGLLEDDRGRRVGLTLDRSRIGVNTAADIYSNYANFSGDDNGHIKFYWWTGSFFEMGFEYILSFSGGGATIIPSYVEISSCDETFGAHNCDNSPNYDYNMATPAGKWTGYGQVIGCCSWLPADGMPDNIRAVCGPSYIPGDGGVCVDMMQDYCESTFVGEPPARRPIAEGPPPPPGSPPLGSQGAPNTDVCCELYLQAGNTTNPVDVREFVQNIVKEGLDKRNNTFNDKDTFFTEAIPKLCAAVPGACDEILRTQFCSKQTRNSLIADKTFKLKQICGCFLPPSQYPYTTSGRSLSICDPICAIDPTLKPGYTDRSNHWSFQECDQDICIIDNVTIDIAEVNGHISFAQNCGCSSGSPSKEGSSNGGATGSCSCYITNVSISGGRINDNISVNQTGCGKCYKFQGDTENAIEIDCYTGLPIGNGGDVSFIDQVLKWLSDNIVTVGIVVGILFLLLILLIVFLARRKGTKKAAVVASKVGEERTGSERTQASRAAAGAPSFF